MTLPETGAAVTAVVDRLVKAGYVIRDHDEADRRRVAVRAIPAKFRELYRYYGPYSAELAKLLAKYSAEQFAASRAFSGGRPVC